HAEHSAVGGIQLEVRKIALATDSAPIASVKTAAALRRATRPKPKNSSAVHATRIDRNGQVTELSVCSLVPRRRSWIDAIRSAAFDCSDFCASIVGRTSSIWRLIEPQPARISAIV